ncbi:MAG: endonuclease/exonuclease/phosphatase family protein [Sphingobacteriales bacterium]|nr:endonuclease/exonuclease/phosphatase family protein [Sphingobacteriales bacterium]
MKKGKPNFWYKIFLFFNLIAIFCLLLSYGATQTDPVKFWYLTLFGLAYPFLILINVFFVIFWTSLKKWYAILSILTILGGLNLLKKTFAFRLKSTNDFTVDSNTIKLMTWNVHSFKKFGTELDTTTRSKALKIIASEQPDIVGFEEFFTRKRGHFDLKDSVLKILNTTYYHFSKGLYNDYEANGVALFSKYPIIASSDIEYDVHNAGNRGLWVDIKKGEQIFRVYVVHLASISFQPQDYTFLNDVKNDINTGKDISSSKRIVRKLKDAFIRRSKQIKILKADMAQCATPYIVMGDFNDTPVSYTVSQMTDGLKNGFNEKGSGLGITYNGDFPNFQIDYILSTPQFDFKSYKIIKKDYSDHYPVRCNVVLHN